MNRTAAASLVERIVMADVRKLRPLSTSVTNAIRLLADDDVNLRKVAASLATDQVIVGKILQHANSAYYGGRVPCTTIADGIMRIGIRQLKHVLYGAAVTGPLRGRLAGYRLNHGELFRHSAAVAAAARRLARMLQVCEPEEAHTAGLLHDIGKLLLERHLRPHINALNKSSHRLARSPIESEYLILGIDHGTVGAMMASRWEYPLRLTEIIRFHHAPSLAMNAQLAAVVLLANTVVLQAGIGVTPLGVEPLNPNVLELLHLRDDELQRIGRQLREEIALHDRQFVIQHRAG